MEGDLIQKQGPEEVLEFEKNVIELESKGSNFGRTCLKLVLEEPSHKFLNVRTGPKVLSKRKNRTTMLLTFAHTMIPARS
jgi:hypothetical protein